MGIENLEEFDRDAEESSEARVVNVSDEVVRFEIAGTPGSKPRRYKLEPYGKPNSGIHIEAGYTKPFKGVGRGMVRATIDSLTEREVYPGGPRLPRVVVEDRAEVVRAAWLEAIANKGKIPDAMVILPRVGGGDPIHAMIASPERTAAAAARAPAKAPVEDVEDQSGALDDDPDPDMAPIDPLALPTVSAEPTPTRKSTAGGARATSAGAR